MHFYAIAFAAAYFGVSIVHASAIVERAALNGPCTGKNNAPGVCIPTAKCSSGGGEFISNRCPGTPNNVKCCTKASCGGGGGGNCRFTSDCTGNTLANQCPGPANFKCCVPKTGGGGGGGGGSGNFPTPSFPAVGACKAKAVDGARKIVAGNPGAVRQIYCTRACACGSGSDHCCGMATDMMCSSAGGVRTESGRAIAEWVMNNRATLNLKYVIWGQKIWQVGNQVTGWANWKTMEDRGSITANHWDHVHVSYK